jgi:SMI1 / KNR4 family (SUKH-1)
MSISIPTTTAATQQTVEALRQIYGKQLPADYLDFADRHDGAKPPLNSFPVGGNNSAGVDQFIPAREAIHIRDLVEGFPQNALPIARASGGNFVYLNPADESVYFWDHEQADGDIQLAVSFDRFLDSLQPKVQTPKLERGQVKRIWSDPNFKPEF